MRSVYISLLLLLLVAAAGGAFGQTLRPRVSLITPSGGQRGTTVAVTLTGVNLGYGTQLLIDAPGLAVETFTPEALAANAKNPEGKVLARVRIAPDAPLGRHPLRVLTPFGPSEVGYFVVGEWPELMEKEPNNAPERAQPLPALPVTLVGRSDGAEDVDVYRVTLQRNETIVFAAAAGGIGSPLEPVLTLRDASRHERAFAAALRRPDVVLPFTAPQAGDYYLSLRDLRYQGSPAHQYRLTVGRVPAVTSVFPLGGTAGATLRLALSGVNLPTPPERTVSLPAEPPFASLPLPDLAGSPRLEVGTLPEAVETEPNDLPGAAQPLAPPVTVNGRIGGSANGTSAGPDADSFRFPAAKGQVFSLEVVAARLGSSLDSVLSVLDANGKELAANDDTRGPDAALTFTSPAAGEYIARVRSLTGVGGETSAYRLRIAPAVPDFQLAFHPDCLAVAPGDRVPFTVTATRLNGFDSEIAVTVDGLPLGMRLIGTPIIARGQNAVTLVATADAEPAAPASGAAPLRVTGTATIGEKPVVRRAESRQRDYVKNGEKVEEATRPVPFPLVTVTGPADLIVTVGEERLTLIAGKTADLKVRVQRRPGFTAKIPLVVQGLPAGVSVASGGEIPENQSEVTLTLKAEANSAPVGISITVLGRSVVDELHFTEHLAAPVALTVAKG